MWAGTWGGGMFMQQGDHFIVPPGLENVNVPMAATLQAADGVTWIGTASGLIRYENGAVKWFGEKGRVESAGRAGHRARPRRHHLVRDARRRAGPFEKRQLKQFLKNDGLSSDYVQCLNPGADGALWIGTYGSGLDRLKNGHFSKITTAEGLPNNFICAIEDDGHGNFWISSHGGIFRVAEKSLDDCADGRIPLRQLSRLWQGRRHALARMFRRPATRRLQTGGRTDLFSHEQGAGGRESR